MSCPHCNWSAHDESVHTGERCLHGHLIERVGRDAQGRCRECRRVRAREHYAAHRDAENARSRAYHWANRDAIVERKRRRRGGPAVVGDRRGHRGAEGAPPPASHPWRR